MTVPLPSPQPQRSFWNAYRALVRWDWVREMKRKDTVVSMVLFSLVTLMILAFAVDPRSLLSEEVRSGILWVTLLLASTIGIDRAFRGDDQAAVLEGVLLAPVGRVSFYYAKVTATYLYVGIMALIVLLVFCWLYNVSGLDASQFAKLVGVILSTVFGVVVLGVPLSAMTRSIHGGEVLLRILMLPLLFPLFRGAVLATEQVFRHEPIDSQALFMIAAFDVIYLFAGQLLIEHVLADFEG
ncbi:MAG: heme exporter protein CcmB [Planctomycetota bacterium]